MQVKGDAEGMIRKDAGEKVHKHLPLMKDMKHWSKRNGL
jgi:hypothetical protein